LKEKGNDRLFQEKCARAQKVTSTRIRRKRAPKERVAFFFNSTIFFSKKRQVLVQGREDRRIFWYTLRAVRCATTESFVPQTGKKNIYDISPKRDRVFL
jgi:hypothetical protein